MKVGHLNVDPSGRGKLLTARCLIPQTHGVKEETFCQSAGGGEILRGSWHSEHCSSVGSQSPGSIWRFYLLQNFHDGS